MVGAKATVSPAARQSFVSIAAQNAVTSPSGATGFVAAFCGGLAFGGAAGRRGPEELSFLEQASGLVSLLVWVAFGAIAVPLMPDRIDVTVGMRPANTVELQVQSCGRGYLVLSDAYFPGWSATVEGRAVTVTP
mgnify:CR=1 FL=1